MKLSTLFPQIYFKTTGYSFTNMGRLFLRLFVGLMLTSLGINQLVNPHHPLEGLYLPFVTAGMPLGLVIVVEIICPFLVMIGLFTRAMLLPPFALMIVSCREAFVTFMGMGDQIIQLSMLTQFLFMGMFFFLIIVGPGKISIDYFFSLYLINRFQQGKEEDLEEV